MKFLLKFVLFVFYTIVLAIIVYIGADCIRLRNAEFGTKPFIVFYENKLELEDKTSESYNEYTGFGYTIKYSYFYDESSENEVIKTGKSAEFRLFGKILIWAWIE